MVLLQPMALMMLCMFLGSCTSATFTIANIPVGFTKIEKQSDISYGHEQSQKLDIYKPKNFEKNAPVIIFFHGGRWTYGKKEQYQFAALPFLKHGYIVVIPNYSKYPDVSFPVFVEDSAKAVSWVFNEIKKYDGDPDSIFLMGHSSGAHIAALMISDPKYLKKYNKDRSIVKAFVGLAGPYDFIPEDPDLKKIFGSPETYALMQVPTFIDGKQPPMLLLHGADDVSVILRNLNRLKDKIKNTGGHVETKIYPDVDHKEIMGALTWVWKNKAPVEQDTLNFFEKYRNKK